MRVWRGLHAVLEPFPASVTAVGVFDGIHTGHQSLIRAAVTHAAGRMPSVVLTFDRHPSELVAPEKAPAYLSTPPEREREFARLGVDDLVVAHFDERFRNLSSEAFLHFVCRGVLGAETLFVGYDFRFGRDQAGDTAYLRSAQERLRFAAQVMDPVTQGGEVASSSRIRELLAEGGVQRAAEMLGRPYRLYGRVIPGRKLGRTLGFPTANLEPRYRQVIPGDGIYAGWACRGSERWMAAASIGIRPTVGVGHRAIEAYLLDFEGDLYGQDLDLEFAVRLRDEVKFDSLSALTSQIARDVEQARAALHGVDPPAGDGG